MDERLRGILPGTAELRRGLRVGGCDLVELATAYGTPLYVYDEATLRGSAARLNEVFGNMGTRVSFAAKACGLLAVLRVFAEMGLGLDVVSGGELEAGLRAGFAPHRIHLHGNFKSDDELRRATICGIHAIVLDNVEEIERLIAIAGDLRKDVNVILRLTFPLEARTHPHLQTSGARSKFGFQAGAREENAALDLLSGAPRLRLIGLHTHLGSQIEDSVIYRDAAEEILQHVEHLGEMGKEIKEISLGGGWAVPYRRESDGPDVTAVAGAARIIADAGLRPAVEPGRYLVARAAIAVYQVGSVKSGETRIIAVDGGIGDNPRPALYGAEYDALTVESPLAPPVGPASVVGRYCESGDLLVRDVALPEVSGGDLIAVPMAGAYHLSMASAYNLVPMPAVVMVEEGRARLIARRGTIDDLLGREEELRGRPGDASVC